MNICKVCGCTDYRACSNGCHWANDSKDICSSCANKIIKYAGYKYQVIEILDNNKVQVIKVGVTKSNTYFDCFNRIMRRIISWPKEYQKDLVKELQEFKIMYETGRFADFYLELKLSLYEN